jgi:hypothetical protein
MVFAFGRKSTMEPAAAISHPMLLAVGILIAQLCITKNFYAFQED